MEHRYGTRRAIDAKVTIDCRPIGLIRGRIQNISAGGLYIKMRPLRGLANDNVKIVLTRRRGSLCRIYRVPAVVIRWSNNGAGLMFNDLSPNAFYTLLSVLLADEQRKAHTGGAAKSGSTPRSNRGSWFSLHDS